MLRTTECIQHIPSFAAGGGGRRENAPSWITNWRVKVLGSVPSSVHELCLILPSLNCLLKMCFMIQKRPHVTLHMFNSAVGQLSFKWTSINWTTTLCLSQWLPSSDSSSCIIFIGSFSPHSLIWVIGMPSTFCIPTFKVSQCLSPFYLSQAYLLHSKLYLGPRGPNQHRKRVYF